MKKIIKIISSIITAILAILVIYLLVINVVAMKKDKPVNFFGYSYSYVPTNSMEPTIMAGDSVIFKKVSYESIVVGDIIVYKSIEKDIYIIHRVNNICEDGFEMLGDNNNGIVDSEHVTKDMFIGKYVKTFNLLNVGKLITNKNVIYIILVVIFVLIFVFEGVNIYLTKVRGSSKKKSKEELKKEVLDEMRRELEEEIKNDKDKS